MTDSGIFIGQWVAEHILMLTAIVMFLLGAFVAYLIYNTPLQQTRRELDYLKLQRQTDEQLHEERLHMLEDAQDRLHHVFATTSQQALRENNAQFLQLAQESMRRFQTESQADLDQRRQSIDYLVAPIKEALQKTEQQIQAIEKDRQASFSTLSEQLRQLSIDQLTLRQETGKLATALRTPSARGQWGELSLKRLVEMAGMIEHCDFIEQVQVTSQERSMRPDLLIRMPDQRELVIDAKSPMDAYLDAIECTSEVERQLALQRYAKRVREHARLLAGKRYWEQFQRAPDFVVMFMPGEQFLGAALEQDKTLMQDALEMRVILATPATLMALLRAVAFGWQQAILTDNAVRIRDTGVELHKRLVILSTHMEKLGKQLNASVESYNSLLGSWERNVLPGAHRLAELGTGSGRDLPDLSSLASYARAPTATHDE